MKLKHRALALILTLIMVLTYMPAFAFAENGNAANGEDRWLITNHVEIEFDEGDDLIELNVNEYLADPDIAQNIKFAWLRDDSHDGTYGPYWQDDASWTLLEEDAPSTLEVTPDWRRYMCVLTEPGTDRVEGITFYLGDYDGPKPFGIESVEYIPATGKLPQGLRNPVEEDDQVVAYDSEGNELYRYTCVYDDAEEDYIWTTDDSDAPEAYANLDDAGFPYDEREYSDIGSTVIMPIIVVVADSIYYTELIPYTIVENDDIFVSNGLVYEWDGYAVTAWALDKAKGNVTVINSVPMHGANIPVKELGWFMSKDITSISIPASVTHIGDKRVGFYYDENDNRVKTPNFVIYGTTGTEAQKYANTYGFTFRDLAAEAAAAKAAAAAAEAARQGTPDSKIPKVKGVKKPTAKKTSVTVKWTKLTSKQQKKAKATKYEIWVCPNKAFGAADTKIKTVGKGKSSAKITGLKKNTKYYVKVRAIRTVGSTKYVGKWSARKTVKTPKK